MGINTADRKPQVVKDPETHKTRVRMVPVDKDVIKTRENKTCSNKRFKEMRQERALSKAELKKRNDVAKSIKKDDPDMPMDKKMAIATSVAKKTAEDVNEISIGKMSNYASAAKKDIEKHRNTVKTALDQPASPKKAKAGMDAMQKLHKRSRGSDMYVNKMTGRSKVKPTAEDVNEVSSNTLGNYMRKSSAAAAKPGASVRTQDKRIGGQKMADNKIRKKMGYSSPAKVPAGKNEGKARDRLVKMVDKASGRTMADRQKDAAAATARRKEADKDLQSFRQKMGK